MSQNAGDAIFILTDHPQGYEPDFGAVDVPVVYVSNTDDLLRHLTQGGQAGMVLDVGKIMAAPPKNRDRIFSYASTVPLLRTRHVAEHDAPAYLDGLDCFLANCSTTASSRKLRCSTRVRVDLECSFSAEDDPMMVRARRGVLRDISCAGGFISCNDPMAREHFVHVRIAALDSPRPIYSSVRWISPGGKDAPPPGMGVLFIDIQPEQDEQIMNTWVLPGAEQDTPAGEGA